MQKIAIVILNTKINQKVFDFYYNPNVFLICADGGANRLYEYKKEIIPKCIIGDLDSLKPEIQDYYQQQNCSIVKIDDQDTSDFEKALSYIQQLDGFQRIIIIGGLTERFDQTINSLHTLVKFNFTGELISDYSIVRYFNQGIHTFQFSEIEQSKGISLFPQGTQARINTKGLKWNVTQNNPLILGKFLSTSNEAIEKQLEFDSLDNFFFVTQLKDEYI
ncbi:unnamed protein product [Paramecium primaurelia]|uniref:Thiamine diphosphokinase n=1 Tax=Paramecium primaurelia TaxID=5886 RepID=A0A8S1NE15_PARPR|nr:unnamed protein product [Paramecium primaurelia]